MSTPQTAFETVSEAVPLLDTTVFTSTPGYNSIVLTCQVVNTSVDTETFTLYLNRGIIQNPLVYEYEIPSKEVLNILGGSLGALVLQTGDSISISGSSALLNFTLSVIKTLI